MDSICATVRELEGAGYIVRERERHADGTLGSTEGLNELIRRHGVKRLAIEDLHMTIGEYEDLRGTLPVELVHAGMAIDKLRAYLTPEDRDALGHGIACWTPPHWRWPTAPRTPCSNLATPLPLSRASISPESWGAVSRISSGLVKTTKR